MPIDVDAQNKAIEELLLAKPWAPKSRTCDICGRSEAEGAVLVLVWSSGGTFVRCDVADGRRSRAHWRRIKAGQKGRLGPSTEDLRLASIMPG